MDASKFYLPNSEFKKLYDSPTLLNITFNTKNASEKEKINEELNKYIEENPLMGYGSSEEVLRRINEEKQKLRVVGGIMAGILGVVGVINLIVTSVITRKNDFAIMECVGMTQKQLKRMIILESVFYGVATGILGVLASYCMVYRLLKRYSHKRGITPFRCH